MLPSQPVTIRQVAQHAGVSRQTVSNVLNAPQKVDPATTSRVRRSIEKLGYRPNRNARNLATHRAGLIGYCVPTRATANPFMDRFLHLFTAAVENSGQHVLLFTDAGRGLDAYADLIAQNAVDGFVLADVVNDDPRHEWLSAQGMPFASFGRTWRGDQPGPWVDVDGAHACRELTRGLAGLGHERIGFVGVRGLTGAYLDRFRGWRESIGELALPVGLRTLADTESVEAGRRAAASLLNTSPPPTAVVAASDVLALGVLDEARRRGLRPGADLAVTGFDDSQLAHVVQGGLTSVRQPLEQIAPLLVEMLGEGEARHVLLRGEVVSRGSAPFDLGREQAMKA